jgi:hypothetical protein
MPQFGEEPPKGLDLMPFERNKRILTMFSRRFSRKWPPCEKTKNSHAVPDTRGRSASDEKTQGGAGWYGPWHCGRLASWGIAYW